MRGVYSASTQHMWRLDAVYTGFWCLITIRWIERFIELVYSLDRLSVGLTGFMWGLYGVYT